MSDCSTKAMLPKEQPKTCGTCSKGTPYLHGDGCGCEAYDDLLEALHRLLDPVMQDIEKVVEKAARYLDE